MIRSESTATSLPDESAYLRRPPLGGRTAGGLALGGFTDGALLPGRVTPFEPLSLALGGRAAGLLPPVLGGRAAGAAGLGGRSVVPPPVALPPAPGRVVPLLGFSGSGLVRTPTVPPAP
jgi:hypothetical protein